MNEWLVIAKVYTVNFEKAKDNKAYLIPLVGLSVPRQIFLMCYKFLWKAKKIPTIEELTPEGKQKTWETAKEIGGDRFKTIEEMKDLCRLLLTLEYLLTL